MDIDLRSGIRRGLMWSSINAIVLRIGTFAVGIFLARMLAPEQFGVFAIALTVQAVLMTLADFGLSTDLIRSQDHAAKAPTVATLGLIAGLGLSALMILSAPSNAQLLGSPEAAPVIAVMSVSLLLAGVGVVPYAKLQREFQQKSLFKISVVDFVVATTLTVVLVLLGWGVMALAVSRIAAQGATLVLQFLFAGVRPKFGFDRGLAPKILAFGIPVAGANMLSWLLLNVDNIMISRLAGPMALGFYYLAFNISNWPMSAIGQVVRSIALPAFSRTSASDGGKAFSTALSLVWPVTMLAGLMLSVLAEPVVELVYGARWLPAAPLLAVLGFFGALRTVFDLAASYLLARGYSGLTLAIQAVWLISLVPIMFLATANRGSEGTAIAHLVCGLAVVFPSYVWALSRAGVGTATVLQSIWPPVVAAVPAYGLVLVLLNTDLPPLAKLLAGGVLGSGVYAACLGRWFSRRLRGALGASPTALTEDPLHTDRASEFEAKEGTP